MTAEYNTNIKMLGPAKVTSSLPLWRHTENRDTVTMHLDPEMIGEPPNGTIPLEIEIAGPRSKIFFDPSKTKCAIVTCGGLCPGINDVIRAIVMEAYHNYKVP